MALKRATILCREGWYYLFVLGFVLTGSLLREINLLIVVAGLLIGVLVYHWWHVVSSLRRLSVSRSLPVGVCAGDVFSVVLTLTSGRQKREHRAIVVADQIRCDTASRKMLHARPEAYCESVPAGGSSRIHYRGRLMHRGRYQFGPLRMSTSFPVGLIRRRVIVEADSALIVYPRLGRLKRRWQRFRHEALAGAQRSGAQGALEGEFYGLRDWRSGDPRRWIHWRTTARRGTLVVRQFQQRQSEDLVLVLDLWRGEQPTKAELRRVETAVSFAATVAADICRRGDCHLRLEIAAEEPVAVEGVASPVLLDEILQVLAVAEAHSDSLDQPMKMTESLGVHQAAPRMVIGTRPALTPAASGGPSAAAGGGVANGKLRMLQIDVGSDQLAEYFEMD